MQGSYDYFPLERVVFGKPLAEALPEEMAHLGCRRAFLVASRSLSRGADVVARLRGALGERFAGLFDEGAPHTPRRVVLAAAAAAREAKADVFVSLGGGSAIDLVKMIQVAIAEGVTRAEQLDPFHIRLGTDGQLVVPPIRPSGVRQIAVPTTLSAAEFTHRAGSVDEQGQKKDLYVRRDLCPVAVVLDPAATVHTPEWLWLSTAIRAVDHAVESICAVNAQPFTDATCLHGLRMLQRSLRATKRDPADLGQRLQSQIGAWLVSSGLARGQHGASHGISYSLAAVAHVPHGHCSCVLLPAVLRFNKPVNADRQALVSDALERPGAEAAEALIGLLKDLGLPTRLQEVGVRREQLAQIARTVVANAQHVRANPRPIRTEAEVMGILESAW
jgi:maleylacetate reductase